MQMMNFLKKRRSTREFKKKQIVGKDLEKIKDIVKEINFEAQQYLIKMKLYEYGENIYQNLKGIAGYSGVMIESPHYIALESEPSKPISMIYSGYFMEKLITELNDLGIGTCWISLSNVNSELKEKAFGEDSETLNYLLAIGYPKPMSPFAVKRFSERIGVEEMVYIDNFEKNVSIEELENLDLGDLFFYVRFAPSILNKQPWRFMLHDGYVELLLIDDGDISYIDAGIIMYYFEELAKIQGMNSQWELVLEQIEHKNVKYIIVGKYKI